MGMSMTGQKKLAAYPPLRLLAITDPGRSGWPATEQAAAAALAAGLPALMIRDRAASDAELLPIARRLQQKARAAGGLLIINRRLDVAAEVGAAGVHLGAQGPAIAQARALLGSDALIGYSAHAIPEALDALAAGADYVTFSPVFATPSKEGILAPVGLAPLAELARQAPGRVVALGGISLENIARVRQTGVAGAAVIRAVFCAPDPAKAVRELLIDKS